MTANQRATEFRATPSPMSVQGSVLKICRQRLEPIWKSRLRAAVLSGARLYFRATEIGEGFQWGWTAKIVGAKIGRYSYVGGGSNLSGPVSVGDLTMVSTMVSIVGNDHLYDDATIPMRLNFTKSARAATVIEADCWIGHGATLFEGVRVARGTVIGAGAVVTKDTEPYSIVVGVPGRIVGLRFSEFKQRQHDVLLYGRVPNYRDAS